MKRMLGVVTAFVVVAAAAACGQGLATPVTPVAGEAGAVGKPVRVEPPFYKTPERAALAAARRYVGSSHESLEAEVVFRFPAPNQDDVRVRVSGERFCAVWGAQRVASGEWFAHGRGRSDMC